MSLICYTLTHQTDEVIKMVAEAIQLKNVTGFAIFEYLRGFGMPEILYPCINVYLSHCLQIVLVRLY